MYERRYNRWKEKISSYKYGESILININKIFTSLVYAMYPLSIVLLIVNKDIRFWKAVLVPAISFIIISLFRNYINLPRPYELYPIVPIIRKDSKGRSFPSRHVFSAFVIGSSLYFVSTYLGVFIMFLGFIIAIARVLGGVHFTRDVVFGSLMGIICSIIGWNLHIF